MARIVDYRVTPASKGPERAQAELLCQAAGVSLDDVLSITFYKDGYVEALRLQDISPKPFTEGTDDD